MAYPCGVMMFMKVEVPGITKQFFLRPYSSCTRQGSHTSRAEMQHPPPSGTTVPSTPSAVQTSCNNALCLHMRAFRIHRTRDGGRLVKRRTGKRTYLAIDRARRDQVRLDGIEVKSAYRTRMRLVAEYQRLGGTTSCLEDVYAYERHGYSLSVRDDLLRVPDIQLAVLHARDDHTAGTLRVDIPPR